MTTRHASGVVAALVVLAALTVASSAQVVRPGFQILIPPDVTPETVKIFFAVAPSGVLPNDSVTTRPGVYDYTLPIAGARFLKLLIYAPGYQTVTAEFKDAQLDASTPYIPPLVTLPAVRSDGRLVDSSGRPVRNYGLYLGYHFMESVDYFCGICMIDGQIPLVSLGETRTDDAGAFSFAVPNVREDPFFRKYAATGVGELYLSSTTRGRGGPDMFDGTLRPSQISAVTVDAQVLIVTHVDLSSLSGRLGPHFLQQQGLGDNPAAYRMGGDATALTEIPDNRLLIGLQANPTDAANVANGIGNYNANLRPNGTFQVSLPPGTYDLTLFIAGPTNTPSRTITIAKGLVVSEGQRLVVDRP